jgi:putative DNA primase/helicase
MEQDILNAPILEYREFWKNDFRVFGLHGANSKGQCGCQNPDCQAVYKHPLVSNWQHTPHWSEDQLEVMVETGQFDTGFGVLIRGGLVIDIDARNGGVESLQKLANDYPSLKKCGLVVKTGSGGGSRHFYFRLPEEMALVQHLDQYPGIDFKSSGFVVGPGSLHASGNRYEVSFGSVDQIEDAPDDIIALLRKPDRHRAVINGLTVDVSQQELADMLACINPDADHDTWVKCGMALHHASNGTAFDVWDGWSAKGSKYPGTDTLHKRWHSFGKASNPVTLATLKYYAEQGGWLEPVTFTPENTDELISKKGEIRKPDTVILLRGDTISPAPTDWLWKDWIASSKMSILAGSPGTGKTSIALEFGAIVSTGRAWPDGTGSTTGNVIIWSGEDGVDDTLVPRLISAGANMEKIFFVDDVREKGGTRTFDPAKDMVALSQTIESVGGAKLIILDPIVSAVSGDSHKNTETRRALQPIVDLARSSGAAVFGITHLSKGNRDASPLDRVTGSLAFGAVARSVYLAVKKALPDEPDDDEITGSYSLIAEESTLSAFIRVKSNVGPKGGGFEYELQHTWLENHANIETSHVVWGKQIRGDAEMLVASYESRKGPSESAVKAASKFLEKLLKKNPILHSAIMAQAQKNGHSESSIRRAKKELNVKSIKQSDGTWLWSLPIIEEKSSDEDGQPE